MDVPSHDELLSRITAFCERHGMAESALGREALNNPAFVSGLRDRDVSPTLKTLNRLAAFMAAKDAEVAAAEAERDAA